MREALARGRASVRQGARTLLSPSAVRGTGVELLWTVTHVAMYPLGMVRGSVRDETDRYTLDGLTAVRRGLVVGDVTAAGTPIVLVHGWVDNHSIFALLRRQLRRRGFGRIVTMNYSVFTHDIPRAARRLAVLVERVCEETGHERVHVVGHSMGGLVARYYVQRLGGDGRVHTLATLGTPHEGTFAARLVPGRAARQCRRGSPIVRELAAPAPGCRTRIVSIWSDLDQLVVPQTSAVLRHRDLTVRNVFVRGVGHMSLPIDRRVVREIVDTFAHLDADGSLATSPGKPATASSAVIDLRDPAVVGVSVQ